MSMSETEVLDLRETLDLTVKSVKSNWRNDVRSKFKIGKELSVANEKAKETNDEKSYDVMFDRLPFGKTTGDKFIRISKTNYLVEIAKSNNASNLPSGYNVLYALTHKDIVDNTYVLSKVTSSFNLGLFVFPGVIDDGSELPDLTIIKSSEIGVTKLKDYIAAVLEDRASKEAKPDPLEDWPKHLNPATGEEWSSRNDDEPKESSTEESESGTLESNMVEKPVEVKPEYKVATILIAEGSYDSDYFKILELKTLIEKLVKDDVAVEFNTNFTKLEDSTKEIFMQMKFEEEMELREAA